MNKTYDVRMNPLIERLVCSKTGDEVPHNNFQKPIGLSPAGVPVEVRYNIDAVRAELDRLPFSARPTPGMWRYAPLLPVSEVPLHFAADVGGTPVFPHPEFSEAFGGTVYMKNEGANPTGSFKDRGLAMAIALGTACGARQFCLPTQGNAGVAGAFFSRRMGVEPCIVHMPEGYQDGIYHRSAAFLGADVEFFGENIAATGKRMREAVAERLASGRRPWDWRSPSISRASPCPTIFFIPQGAVPVWSGSGRRLRNSRRWDC
jgi:threonine synthase